MARIKVLKGKNYKVEIRLDALDKLSNPELIPNTSMQNNLGRSILKEMKSLIAVGQSPVKGIGRFEAYAKQRNGEGYPEISSVKKKFPSKKTRPVNLKLSGEYLDELQFKKSKKGIELGWLNASQHIKDLIETHNEGKNKHVPKRKILPTEDGDEFTSLIQRVIKNIFLKRIREIIK